MMPKIPPKYPPKTSYLGSLKGFSKFGNYVFKDYFTRDYYGAEKRRFWPKSAIFFPVNNFPRRNKNPPTQLFGFLGGMSHDTLHVAFNMFNKHIQLFIRAIRAKLHKLCNKRLDFREKVKQKLRIK